MFGRRNPDRPLDPPLPAGQEIEDLNLDLLDDLPDTVEPENAKPAESAPTTPGIPSQAGTPTEKLAAPATEPAWQPTPSILGPSVTRMLHTPPEAPAEDSVPRTDLSSPPPRTPVAPVFQMPSSAPGMPFTPSPTPAPPVAATPTAPTPVAAAPTPTAAARPAARQIAESVIGPDDFFDGRYRSERGVRIQGNARGSIESRQYIFVEGGALDGELHMRIEAAEATVEQ